jgi:hypothetical protein
VVARHPIVAVVDDHPRAIRDAERFELMSQLVRRRHLDIKPFPLWSEIEMSRSET